jgi:hypothetical protein
MPRRSRISSGGDWPTTLRFSRRLGEAVRDSAYASAIEGPQESPAPLLEAGSGLMRRIAQFLARVAAIPVGNAA